MESVKNFFSNNRYDNVIFESENFIAIPSLGSMIEGWLLVVPKNFRINLSQLLYNEYIELSDFLNRIAIKYRDIYGDFRNV